MIKRIGKCMIIIFILSCFILFVPVPTFVQFSEYGYMIRDGVQIEDSVYIEIEATWWRNLFQRWNMSVPGADTLGEGMPFRAWELQNRLRISSVNGRLVMEGYEPSVYDIFHVHLFAGMVWGSAINYIATASPTWRSLSFYFDPSQENIMIRPVPVFRQPREWLYFFASTDEEKSGYDIMEYFRSFLGEGMIQIAQ